MSLFIENMEYIKKNNPALFKTLEKGLSSIEQKDDSVALRVNKTGGLNIKVKNGSNEFYIHSNYNPQVEAQRWAESVDSKAELIVVLGLGLGYHIEELLKRLADNRRVCIIEPDIKIFKYFLENRPMQEIFDKRVSLICNSDAWTIAAEMFGIIKERLLDKIEFKAYSNYSVLYGALFEDIQEKIADVVRTLTVNVATTEYFKELWTLNFLVNASCISNSANGISMHDRFKGMPAIIVSAGPSLSKNVHLLKDIKDKAIIIAGGSAIGILSKHGIKPHFMVAMDGDPREKDIFDGIDFKDISLIYINRLYYEIAQAYNGRKFTFIDGQDKFSMYLGKHIGVDFHALEPDQTVGGLNIGVASYLGCNPIIFVGQDMGLTNLNLHAEGAAHMVNFEEELKKSPNSYIKMQDIYGKDMYTTKPFLAARMSMERKIVEAHNLGYKFINATEGGLGLKECDNMDLKEAIETHLARAYEVGSIIDENFKEGLFNVSREEMKAFYSHINTETEKMKECASELYDICVKLKKVLESKNFNNDKYSRLAVKANEIQAAIENSEFYRDFLLSALEQTVGVHKIIMEKELNNVENQINKNAARVKFITNQAVEIIGMCNFIKSVKDQYLDKIM